MTTQGEALSGLDTGGLFPRLQSAYGLHSDPLAMEAPFFPDAGRQHALESLRHLCGFGDMALVLTGARGAGKSRILAELVRSESSRLAFHHLPAGTLTSTQALARALMSLMQGSVTSNDFSARDVVYRFFRWSEAGARKGQRRVLLIDDADQIPGELLRLMLAAYQASERGSAAVPVFAGSDQLAQVFVQPGGDPDYAGIHHIQLRPLTRGETYTYLEPRVRAAGGDVKVLLAPRHLDQIHGLSQGSFGRLKRVAPAVWLGLGSPPARGSEGRFPGLSALRWPALALLLLAVSWWVVSSQYDSVSDTAQLPDAPPVARKTISIGPENPELPSVRDSVDRDASPQPGPVTPEDGPARLPPEEEAPVTAPVGPDRDSELLSDEGIVQPVPETPPPVPEEELPPGPDEDEAALALAPEPEPAFSPALPERFVPVEQLRAAGGYTAQYIAGYEETTVLSFLARHEDVDGLRYTRSERKGRPWFVVFYGKFESPGAVREALASLPSGLSQQDTWIRSLESF
ncbi:AAA family ATPase [Marinobacter sp.]|uniref:AAA family ATPase n=1 Tax=Marinobacter sp. TaxID=50741 RepID=UPI00385049DA